MEAVSQPSYVGDSFLSHRANRESLEWQTMRRAKNRRICGAIREAMESVQRQHKTELRSHRHTVAMKRQKLQAAKARELQAQKDAVKRRQVEEVMRKRAEQADATERRLQEAQARAETGMRERLEGIQKKFEARRQKEAQKTTRREEAVELSLALQHQQHLKFQESAAAKAQRVRQQQHKNEQVDRKHAEFVKRLAIEKRANAARTKATLSAEAEQRLLQRQAYDARRHALRAQQAEKLQHRRKLLERDLWIDADNAKQGLAKFLQSGKANDALMAAVRDADDTELETTLRSASNQLSELSLSRRSQNFGRLPSFSPPHEEPSEPLDPTTHEQSFLPKPQHDATTSETTTRQLVERQGMQSYSTRRVMRPASSPMPNTRFGAPRLSLLA